MRFLGNVLATIIGLFIFCMFAFFGILLIAAVAGGGTEEITVKSKSVIELDLKEVTLDYGGKSNYKEFDYFEVNYDGLSNIINAIEAAKTDSKIEGISILNNYSNLGIAQTKALRDALADFKTSGKFVLSYADVYTQKDYYLNSVANTVYINPIGSLEFKGLSSEIMFFKDLQEKSGIKMEVIRHGKYKSAVEPFLENKMSDANREQVSALLNSVWNSIVPEIAESRKVSANQLNTIADGLLARTPEMAKSQHLVDIIAYEDTYHDDIRKKLDVKKDQKYNKIKILDYAKNVATTSKATLATNQIAIIYAQGEILSGEGSETYIGEGAMRRALRAARRDDNVKAVVLRIDSPGGSAMTSELIWREIELTKKEKPVVVSMGNMAASGGYYIACNANSIYAEANTITGSIGVFGILPNMTQLSEKIGIHTEQVNTHTNAADYSPFLPLDDKMRLLAQDEVERIYTTFVNRVATGRKMTYDQVDNIAQGRVWAGTQAVKIGLVDKIGGMDDAIKAAAKLAKIDKYRTKDYPEYEKSFRDLLAGMGVPLMSSKESLIKNEVGAENYKIIEQLKRATQKTGIQAAMPFEINIH